MHSTHSDIQAVLFDRNYWTITQSKKWLAVHHLHPIKPVHATKRFYRYRLHLPSDFRILRTHKTGDHMDLIIGFY